MSKSVQSRRLLAAIHKLRGQRGIAQVQSSHDTDGITAAASPEVAPKTLMDLNGPKGLPFLGNFLTYLKKSNRGKMHKVQAELHDKYGPIFREKWGPKWQLHVSDPRVIEEVYRVDQKYPLRPPLRSWRLYQKDAGLPSGLITGMGEEWHRVRQVLSKQMLKPKSAANYCPEFNDITDELISHLRTERVKVGDQQLTENLTNELYRWAMECAGQVLVSTRLGALRDPMPEQVQGFINAVDDMMKSGLIILVGEEMHYKFNTVFWRKHKAAWDKIFEIGKGYIDEKVRQIEKGLPALEEGQATQSNLLEFLLANGKFSREDIYVNMTELLLSGIDTTSNTTCFAIYLLARNPKTQEALRTEINDVIGQERPSGEHFEKMPYMKAVIHETLRLFPTATMNVRVLQEDAMISGYAVPKDTMCVLNHYAACRNPENFEKPNEFIPERWLRDQDNKLAHNPFTSLPFGFGVRGCIGKRIANAELSVVLTKLLQNFDIHWTGDDIKPYLRTLLTPGETVPVRFVDRNEV